MSQSIDKAVFMYMYADDTHLYTHEIPSNILIAASALYEDLDSVKSWSYHNALTLNESKCVYMFLGSKNNLNKINASHCKLSINDSDLPHVNSAKNLGVIFDPMLSWESHVTSLLSKSYFKLRHLYRFKNFLSTTIKLRLCNTLILSNFNYCDVLFLNLSVNLQNKIQKVQNACLRFSYSVRKYDHISPSLYASGWLNMYNRRCLHSLCMVYKIKNNLAPSYLKDILYRNVVPHLHLTRHSNHIPIPSFHTSIKEKSFFVKAVRDFNALPTDIRDSISISSLKSKLYKHLLNLQCS